MGLNDTIKVIAYGTFSVASTYSQAQVDAKVATLNASISAVQIGKNKIINGAQLIDQRNAGASYSLVTGGYITDRFYTNINPGSQPHRSTGICCTGWIPKQLETDRRHWWYCDQLHGKHVCASRIEGYNLADLGWGAAGASAATLSFWVRSSVTGTYSVGFGRR
jgi:hypothetical protein